MNRVEINNEDFPDLPLLTIFKYLLPSDRRVASECCGRFHKIWLDNKFIGDRRLVFAERPDNDAIEAFTNTQREYDHIVLSKYFPSEGYVDVWTKLGKTVTKLEFVGEYLTDEHFWKMFPELKVLIIKRKLLPKHLDQLPESLELISLDGVAKEELEKLNVEYLRKKSGPKSIEMKNFNLDDAGVLRFIEEHQQKIIRIENSNLPVHGESFRSIDLPNLKYLKIKLRYCNESFYVDLQKKYPDLQYLDLTFIAGLPLQNWMFLKKLTVSTTTENEMMQLAMFENLEELEFRYFQYIQRDCFFVHDPLLNENLKVLTVLNVGGDACLDCFESMTKTFPNIEKLSLTMNITNVHLGVLHENLPKLKSLTVNGSAGSTLSFEDFQNLSELRLSDGIIVDAEHWPLMPHLRSLALKVNEENVKLFEKTPALEYLEIHCDVKGSTKIFEMIEKVVKHLNRIRNLKLICHPEVQNLDILKIDLERNVKNYSRYFKHIDIGI